MNRQYRRKKEQEFRKYNRKLFKEQNMRKDIVSAVKDYFYYILNNKK